MCVCDDTFYALMLALLQNFKLTIHSQVLIHYLGDEKTAQDFSHGNQKKNPERNYCQQCPSLRKRITEQVATTDPAKLYKTEIAAMDCHPALAKVIKPRDIKQVYQYDNTNMYRAAARGVA